MGMGVLSEQKALISWWTRNDFMPNKKKCEQTTEICSQTPVIPASGPCNRGIVLKFAL